MGDFGKGAGGGAPLSIADMAEYSWDAGLCAKVGLSEPSYALCREVLENSAVLLRNNGILPLLQKKVLVIGGLANETYATGEPSFLDVLAMKKTEFDYAQGYDDGRRFGAKKLLLEAVEKARRAGTVIVLCDGKRAELIESICEVNNNVVVVLYGECPTETTVPFSERVSAVLWIAGGFEATGTSVYDLLFGYANPSGKNAEGYGLSYTTFELRHESVEGATARVELVNTGSLAGKEVVRCYVDGELGCYAKVALRPNESNIVRFELNAEAVADKKITIKI